MTDDAMKDLVTKHDRVIEQLVASNSQIVNSVEHLVEAQKESNVRQEATNSRLEEISKFLAKQAVFGNKLDNLDRELGDSFKRVHHRVDELESTQKSEKGCNSVRLLTKDVETLQRDSIHTTGQVEENRLMVENLIKVQSSYISGATLKWVVGAALMYIVSFGVYTVKTFSAIEKLEAKREVKLARDLEDTKWLMKIHREERRSK